MIRLKNKYGKIRRIPRKAVLFYTIVLVVILDSSSMYCLLVDGPLFGRGFGALLCVLCWTYVLRSKNLHITRSLLNVFLGTTLYLLIHVILTRYNVKNYLCSFVIVYISFFVFSVALYQNNQMKYFLYIFSNVMVIVAFSSLFFWLLGSVFDFLPGRTSLVYYWAEHYRVTHSYWYLYFENQSQNLVHGTSCNLGIFSEAPGYAGFLTYALLIEIIRRDEIKEKTSNMFRIIVLILTLISTNSTKGILAVLIAVSLDYISKKKYEKIQIVIRTIIAIIIIIVAAIMGYNIIRIKLETSSGIVRLDDLRAAAKTFINHPLFGAGYGNDREIWNNQLVVRDNGGLSMGLTVLLAYGGLWLFFFYASAVVKSYKCECRLIPNRKWFLATIVLIYNLFVSNCAFSDPYIFLIASAFSAPHCENIHLWRIEDNNAQHKKELYL